jgi:putative transposase
MPKRRYEQREPTQDWQQLRPLLKDPAQMTYEVIRPVILWGQTPQERAAETGVSSRTIYYKANLFDQAGMASLLPPAPPPEVPRQDKRSLPPDIRQEIVDLHTQYPAFRPHELATICFVKFNRKPAPATIKLILASGPKPSTTERRYKRYGEIEDGAERRRTVIRLHAEGWNAKSIAGYLDVSRKTVHAILRSFAEEQFAGMEDKSHARRGPRKVNIATIQEIKKLAENPLLGAYRVSAALEQMGIKLSRATCGRYLSVNRSLYHLQMPRRPRPKAEMPFRAVRRHEYVIGIVRRYSTLSSRG